MKKKEKNNDIIAEMVEQIIEADEWALLKHIKANAVVLNKDFDFSSSFLGRLNNKNVCISPMICGKHIFVGKLPKDYSFVLTEVNEKAYQTELDYYKKRCEELENKLEQIKELL